MISSRSVLASIFRESFKISQSGWNASHALKFIVKGNGQILINRIKDF